MRKWDIWEVMRTGCRSEGGVLMSGVSALGGVTREPASSPVTTLTPLHEDAVGGGQSATGKRGLTRTRPCQHPDLFQSPGL